VLECEGVGGLGTFVGDGLDFREVGFGFLHGETGQERTRTRGRTRTKLRSANVATRRE
jgi:hypothetical protein